MTLVNIINQHLELAHNNGYCATMYITCVDCDGDLIKIRVADHCCNDYNNNVRCISFITNSNVRKSSQLANVTEWVINEEGEDNNGNTVSDILSDFCLVCTKYGNNNITI